MKGLERSLSRGNALTKQNVTRHKIVVEDLTLNVAAVSTAVGFGTAIAGYLPEGNILLLGVVGYLKFDGSGADANLVDTFEGDFSVGSAPTADVTLDGAEVDLLPSTALVAATAEVGVRTRAVNPVQTILDNTANALEVNINMLIDAADITDDESCAITVNGEIELCYIVLGDD